MNTADSRMPPVRRRCSSGGGADTCNSNSDAQIEDIHFHDSTSDAKGRHIQTAYVVILALALSGLII